MVQMSRSSNNNSMAVTVPAALRPATLRAGMALAVAAALTAFAVRLQAQAPDSKAFHVRPIAGALLPTGDERDLLKNAVLVGGQATYSFIPSLAIVGSFGWSPSKDKTSPVDAKVDLYQYDLGLEARASNLTNGSSVSTRPYAAIGGGARTYNLRNVPGASAQTNPLGYGAVGLDVGQADGGFGIRLEVRDNVTWFKGLRGELQERKSRNDVQLAAGLAFGF
jgi:hypothetical protein